MNDSETVQQKAERGVKATREFLEHLDDRLSYYEGRGDTDHADAIKHVMVGVGKVLAFEQNTLHREEAKAAKS